MIYRDWFERARAEEAPPGRAGMERSMELIIVNFSSLSFGYVGIFTMLYPVT
jgi:hypothetical protein